MVLVHLELIINSSTCRFSVWRPLCARLHAEMKVVERRRRVRALHQRRKKDKKVRDCLKHQMKSKLLSIKYWCTKISTKGKSTLKILKW